MYKTFIDSNRLFKIRYLQTLVLILCIYTASAQYGPPPTYYKTSSASFTYSNIDTSASKNLYVRDLITFIPCYGDSGGVMQIKKASINGVLKLGDDYRFGKNYFSYVVNITINGYSTYSGGSPGPIFTQTKQLVVNYSSILPCNPMQEFSFDFTTQYNLINRFVVTASFASTSSGLTSMNSALNLHVFYKEDFEYSYTSAVTPNVDLTAITSPASANPMTFNWTPHCVGAPDYEFQLLRLYNIDPAKTADSSIIHAVVDWNQALDIETGSSLAQLKLTIAEGTGYYVWRVRDIGNAFDGGIANDRNWGPWSDMTLFTQGAGVDLTSSSSRTNLFFYKEFDDDKNWIYSRTFVEGDRRDNTPVNIAENMVYANSLQMIKQKQVKLVTENKLLVSQTIQDFSGRASLVTMAAPLDSAKFGYINGYIKNGSGLYTAADFDADANYNNASSTAINSSSQLASYYSDSNPDPAIPASDGFAFSRTLYFRDGTNRPKEQSSPGSVHKIKPAADTTHTIRNSYSSIADFELIRVMGDEAPISSSVHKMITTDANNSSSITYVSKEGQTIATCMSKPGSSLLNALPSQAGAGFTVTDTIKNSLPYGNYGLMSVKNVSFTESTIVTLNYDITPALYGDSCNSICSSCDYKVTFFIQNINDTAGNFTHSEIINPDSCSANHSHTYSHVTASLAPGDYVIERRVEANNINPASGSTYIFEKDSVLNHQLNAMFAIGSGINLYNGLTKSMDSVYHFLKTNNIDGLNTYLGASESDSVRLITLGCDTLKIPIEHCQKKTCGTITFEEYLLARLDTTRAHSKTIADYIPGYSAGTFNTMISNMLSSGLGYTCDQLWTCWQALVQNYQNNLNLIAGINSSPNTSGVHPTADLLSDFLNCTGYHIRGCTTSAFGTPGYLSYPFTYFKYSLGDNPVCEHASCGSTSCTFDTAGFTSAQWRNFYLCVKHTNASAAPKRNSSMIIAMTHQMVDSCKATCEARFDSFVTSLTDLYQGHAIKVIGHPYPTPDSMPATDSVTLNKVYCQTQNLVNRCSNQCDLTIFTRDGYVTIDSVGTPAQHTAMVEALSYNYDLAFTESGNHCGANVIVSDSIDAMDEMEQFLNHKLDAIKDTANSSGVSWNYLTPLTLFEPALYHTSFWDNMNTHPYVYVQPGVPSYFVKNTSPSITHIDSVSNSYFKYERIIQKNIKIGSTFNVTTKIILKDSVSSSDSLSFSETLASSMLRLVSGTLSLKRYGPLAIGYEITSTYTVHDSSATSPDTLSTAITGNAVRHGTSTSLSSYLLMVTCPTLYYYFNTPKPSQPLAPQKPMVSTSYVSAGTNGFAYSAYSHITIDSLSRISPDTKASAYLFGSGFNINLSSPSVVYFTGLQNAMSFAAWGLRDTTHIYNYKKPTWQGDLGYVPASAGTPASFKTYCGTKSDCAPICLSWKQIAFPDTLTDTILPITCAQQAAAYIKTYLANETDRMIANHRAKLIAAYHDKCVNSANILDHFSASYLLGYYHYTLYYYDRAGNLIKTVPPKGVNDSSTTRSQHPNHHYVTEYRPNSLKQIVRQKTPDGGETRFWYDNKSRLRFSQNAKQLIDGDYSYTIYDNLGRINEVGRLHNLDTLQASAQSYPATGSEKERTITVYSTPASGITYFNNLPQRYLQNRVSYSYTDVDGNRVSTYFSYDPHGNVEWVIQEQPELGKTYLSYQYDVISGSVLQVSYNEQLPDKFFHRYTYDTDKRIKTVATSKDGVVWDTDASYKYYAHGPLKRAVIGQDSVQGLDYVYTIQGWLKGMNHSSLDPDKDPSKDGKVSTAHAFTAKDVYGMVLGYYSGDFNRSSSPYYHGAAYDLAGTPLYNGNISSWTNNIGYTAGLRREQLTGNIYRYDELNRLASSDFRYYDSGWHDTTTFDEAFAYDANGNITKLLRNGYKTTDNVFMDSLTYKYEANTNRLNYVKDSVLFAPYATDIDNQSANNYKYDAIGNLISDVKEGIDTIKWNVYGKIKYIVKSSGDRINFFYNAAGQRVRKEVIPYATPNIITSTYYSNDASGNQMAIYERTSTGTSPNYTATIKMIEQPIYGSDRIGEHTAALTVATENYTSTTPPVAGSTAIQHIDTLSPAYLPVVRFNFVSHYIWPITYYSIVNYAGAEQLNTVTPAAQTAVLLSAANAMQGRYTAGVKDDCGKIILSANSVTRTVTGSPQVCLVYDASNHLLTNSSNILAGNQSQMAFIKDPGSDNLYYLFTIGADHKAYVHTIDIAQGKVLYKNNLLDINGGYGCAMKVLEDLASGGSSQLYLRRNKSTNDTTYIMAFEITSGGIGLPVVLTKFASKDINGIGEIDLNPDATKMLVANTIGGRIYWFWHTSFKAGELRLFTLNAAHNAITASAGVNLGIYTSARSIAFNAAGTNIYYNKYKYGVYSLNKYSSTFTSPVTIVSPQAAGDIRRGNNDHLYSPKTGATLVYDITDGSTPTVNSPLTASIGTIFTGGLQMNKHLITHGLNCTNSSYFTRTLLNKAYELKDHLGNIREIISDMKLWTDANSNSTPDGGEFSAETKVYSNYYAFGSLQPGRFYAGASDYRHGFNGKEKDDEIKGSGNSYNFGARIYDPRVGRWLSLDPLQAKYSELSPYNFVADSPILHLDPDGNEIWIAFQWDDKKGNSHIEKVQYKNGDLYGTNGKKYTTNNVYFNAVKDHLNEIKKDDKDTKVIVDYLETNKENNTITNDDATRRPYEQGSGNYNREVDPEENQTPKSTVTKFDNSNYNVNGEKRNPRVSLIHELKHAFDRNMGTIDSKLKDIVSGTNRAEIDAVKIENKSRAKTGDATRTQYGGKDIPEIKK